MKTDAAGAELSCVCKKKHKTQIKKSKQLYSFLLQNRGQPIKEKRSEMKRHTKTLHSPHTKENPDAMKLRLGIEDKHEDFRFSNQSYRGCCARPA